MAGIMNSNSGIIRAYFERRRQTRDCAAPTLSFLICLLRLPDGQNKKAWHQGLRKDSKSKRGKHQSTDLWKVMIISQKHWQWTFSVSKSEGDMSPLVIIFAVSCQSLQSGGNRKNSAAFGRSPPLDVDGALYGWFAYLLAFLLLIWYEWERLGCFLKWRCEIQPNSWSWGDAGDTQHEPWRKEGNFSNYVLCRSRDAAGFARVRWDTGLSLPCVVSWTRSHRETFMLLSALFGSCILMGKNGSITFTDCEDEDLVKIKNKKPTKNVI